jgi:hypothetical protein
LTFTAKGLIRVFSNAKEASEGLGIDTTTLKKTLLDYADSAKSGNDSFGKTLFPVVFKLDEPLRKLLNNAKSLMFCRCDDNHSIDSLHYGRR